MSQAIKSSNDPTEKSPFPKWEITYLQISKRWFILSIGALLLAGLMSLSFIFGRAPVISRIFTDPLWIKRVLVVHVDLALIIFLYSFICGLFLLIPHRVSTTALQRPALYLAMTGTLILILNLFIPGTAPSLNNYVPVLNHSFYLIGLLIFGIAIILGVANQKLWINPGTLPESVSVLPKAAIPALQAAAFLFIISILLFVISWFKTAPNTDISFYYERLMWGGGHILQYVNAAATVAVWIILFKKITHQEVVNYKISRALFLIYVIPVLFSPLLLKSEEGTASATYYYGFTQYMRWGIFPIISTFILIVTYRLIRFKKTNLPQDSLKHNPYLNGLIVSLSFMTLGFLIGASIRASNTLIPAHYHSTLGSVTVAFMTVTYYLLEIFKKPFPSPKIKKIAARQPVIFGIGMFLFVIGFAYAGAYGLARKSFGTEQIIDNREAMIGLIIAGVGGLIAVAGGIMFAFVLYKSLRQKLS